MKSHAYTKQYEVSHIRQTLNFRHNIYDCTYSCTYMIVFVPYTHVNACSYMCVHAKFKHVHEEKGQARIHPEQSVIFSFKKSDTLRFVNVCQCVYCIYI